jgi:hypothetical protein
MTRGLLLGEVPACILIGEPPVCSHIPFDLEPCNTGRVRFIGSLLEGAPSDHCRSEFVRQGSLAKGERRGLSEVYHA